jgi:hypothetical protein
MLTAAGTAGAYALITYVPPRRLTRGSSVEYGGAYADRRPR